MRNLLLAGALLLAVVVPARADRPVTDEERAKLAPAIAAAGCSGGKLQAGGSGRTAYPFVGAPCLSVTPHHCRNRRWLRAGRSYSHWPRQNPVLFVDRAGAEDRASSGVGAIIPVPLIRRRQGLMRFCQRLHAIPRRDSQVTLSQ
jgi:hypothetical protein